MQNVLSFILSIVLAVLVFAGLRYAFIELLGMGSGTARWVSLVVGIIILIPVQRAVRSALSD
ncbi:hypothetical protein SAMN05445756_1979 [Kytococcus aerolatus]|uniref:Uncharacterized protein n=1 Tax=Kytococcus aerolatus TaxID=592308 RepID=A0A212U5J2_9MICO|nr:hypothetical protein [Kytococcus aerolatus]SNC73466.1 hypothetical protein SAMN05445756_1979 [Kytococcus aerolatus]